MLKFYTQHGRFPRGRSELPDEAVEHVAKLKEAVLRTGCLNAVTSVAGNSSLKPEVLAERLMLAIFGYGTNTGIRAVASGGHSHSEDDIRYVRRRYLTPQIAQYIAIAIANATFTARDASLWGEGTTTVASDSTHVRAYDQNNFTEWHSRYGGRGLLIYWHVERGSMVVHSQTLRASASEVHAMVEGAVRHGTTMKVEGNYIDSHGQSEIGFGVTRLLGFDLLPRIKQINKVKLYRVESGEGDLYARLTPAKTRPIRWDLIEQNYDQMIKYATAIKQGTAATEAILRRFTDSASHPTYQAMLEVGRAQKTIFVALLWNLLCQVMPERVVRLPADVVLDEAVCQRDRQFFRRGPWRSFRALAPGQMHLDETGGVVLDSEQDFITATTAGDRDDRLAEERVSFAGFEAELSFEDLPGPRIRQQHPWIRQRTRLTIEQVVDVGIQPAIRPRLRRPCVSRGESAACRASPQFAG
ncbi:Tn3 family transposase [Actinomycetes bacterium KLBMP 9797]